MRILLVEDDQRIAKALAETLQDRHYLVDIATDGEAGWDFVESFSYELILLDVMLPKLDGISFCQRLRRSGKMTPVLMLTAKDTSSLLELLLRSHGRVQSRSAILEQLWAWDDPPGEDAVKVHIKDLRKKLRAAGAPPDLIQTVYGIGYRLKQN